MVSQTEFRIDVVVDPAKSKAGTRNVARDLDRVEQQAQELRQELVRALSTRDAGTTAALQKVNATLERTELQAEIAAGRLRTIDDGIDNLRLRRFNDGLDTTQRKGVALARTLRRAFAGIGIAFLIKQYADLADTFTNTQNRLRLVTSSTEDLIATQRELFEIANRSRSAFDGTATIFQRLAVSAKDLGTNNAELLRFTESLNQAIILSGAGAQEARQGLIQLSQGLAAGALRGDELRSVLEQLPAVADVISKKLGVTRGRLRELGKEGKITSRIILDAFAEAREELAERFATTVPTIGQAFTVLGNKTLELVGKFDQAIGLSRNFSSFLLVVGDNIEPVAIAVGSLAVALAAKLAATAIPAAIVALKALSVQALATTAVITGAAASVFFLAKRIQDHNKNVAEMEEAYKNAVPSGTLTRFSILGQRIQETRDRLAQLNKVLDANDGQNRAAEIEIARLTTRLEKLTGVYNEQAEAGRKANEVRAAANAQAVGADVIAALEREAELLTKTSEERRILQELDQTASTLKKRGVDLTKDSGRALLAEAEALIRSNDAARERNRIADAEAAREARKVRKQETKKPEDPFRAQLDSLTQLNEQLAIQANNEGIRERALLIQLELAEKGRRLSIDEANLLDKVLRRRAELTEQIDEQKKAEAALNAEKRKQEMLEARLAAAQQNRIDSLREQIDLTRQFRQEEEDLRALREQAPELTREIAAAAEDLRLRQLEASKEFNAGIERAFIKIRQEAEDLAAVGEQVVNVFADRATEALITFAREGELNFKEFALSILDDLAVILARLLVVQALSAAFGIAGGPGGAAGNLVVGAINQGRQGGGTVQPGQRPFKVGEGGEELFLPNRTGTIVPNPASVPVPAPQVNVQLVTVQNDSMVQEVIASGAADDVIIQRIGENKQRVRQAQA